MTTTTDGEARSLDQEHGLVECLRRFAAGSATGEEVTAALLGSVVFLKRADRPGFLLRHAVEGPYLPVYSSEIELARSEGPVGWFTGTGATILGLLPPGCAVALDPGSDHAAVLNASAIGVYGDEQAQGGAG